MPDQPRALRNLYEDITHAHKQLCQARLDGGCEAIIFWAARVDELLDRLSATQAQGVPE